MPVEIDGALQQLPDLAAFAAEQQDRARRLVAFRQHRRESPGRLHAPEQFEGTGIGVITRF